ncbi:hypothetical protein ACFXD5_17850 [Streptomyces sp. NPDC059385]|uniref:hypothetical protein n=1 Tax=Streptomyces sp. NPDC059385 TaxID=3346817 RepID=UPI0036A0ED06
MTHHRESIDLPEDRGCLQWVLGIPLGLLNAVNGLLVYAAVRYGPQAEWDDQGYAGTAAACLFALMLSVLALLITLIPTFRRTLGLWWFAPPIVMGVIAWVRIATLE